MWPVTAGFLEDVLVLCSSQTRHWCFKRECCMSLCKKIVGGQILTLKVLLCCSVMVPDECCKKTRREQTKMII